MPMNIAIDGPVGAGKSSIADQVAQRLHILHLDTGAMYRSVTLFALRNGLFNADGSVKADDLKEMLPQVNVSFKLNAATGLPETYLNGEMVERDIRGMEVSSHVSPIAAIPFVREALVAQQKAMGKEKGVVMDGRDIGTVVFPDAELKIFVTASPEVRAKRRYDELQAKGQPADYDDILKNVQQRDYIDTHREVSPLRQAEDAIVLDNSHMTIEEQDAWLIDKYQLAAK